MWPSELEPGFPQCNQQKVSIFGGIYLQNKTFNSATYKKIHKPNEGISLDTSGKREQFSKKIDNIKRVWFFCGVLLQSTKIVHLEAKENALIFLKFTVELDEVCPSSLMQPLKNQSWEN